MKMSQENDDDFHQVLQRLQCQFLCTFPVKSIDWQVLKLELKIKQFELLKYPQFQPLTQYTSWEQQKQILDATCGHPLNQQQPVKIEYQLSFLKYLLQLLERHCTEVHDEIYEEYCQLQLKLTAEVQDKNFAYKHYLLPYYRTHFTLRESKSFVTEGTTGLCSWQASLALADYILHHADIVSKKAVLELGAGTGLCGFIISRCCAATHVSLTDGSLECVELMRENISRNFSNASEKERGFFEIAEQLLTCWQLNWNQVEEAEVANRIKPDVILAADVVYDTSVLDDLSKTVDYIFKMMLNETKMLLAATVRNEETLGEFLEFLARLNFNVEEQLVIPLEKSHLHWDRSTPVKIFLITRS